LSLFTSSSPAPPGGDRAGRRAYRPARLRRRRPVVPRFHWRRSWFW